MSGAPTLLHVLRRRAESEPERAAAWYRELPLPYRDLWSAVEHAAGAYRASGVGPGERVLIALPNGLEFFAAFYGAQRAGAAAVCVYPGSPPERLAALAARAQARLLVGEKGRFGSAASLTPEDLKHGQTDPGAPMPGASDIALLQYTSGSTGEPKGVMIPHGALIANIEQMIAGMGITARERFVSWLPVYHDMGLILKTMTPMYIGAETHLLPTSLSDIDAWLAAIERVRATFTAAPDFAWRLCARRPLQRDYDLSSLRVALNAAEPVRNETIQRFEARFGLKAVMASGYGLAEATVGVAMTAPGKTPKADARGTVSVGRAFPGVEIEIRNGGAPAAHGAVGDIHIRSIANSAGYFEDRGGVQSLFDARGFLDSGDLGYLDEAGELYIVGRRKNVIIVAGRTFAPREIEVAAEADPAVRLAAAIGVETDARAGEQVVVLAEVRQNETAKFAETAAAIARRVAESVGVRPFAVHLLAPGRIPMTHNGKVQHSLLKQLYGDGSLARSGGMVFPPAATA
jgi:acyl-CoA synthetase (AMP-forming)/AMP-acid ligase II